MKTITFLTARPPALPAGSRLHDLVWKPRYDRPTPPPAVFADASYMLEAPAYASGSAPELGPAPENSILHLLVEDEVMFSRPGAGPGTGGVMRLLLSVRRPDLSREAFANHWRKVHAPLALERAPHYDHYVTNILDERHQEWDGVLQEWFPDEAAFDEHEQGLTDRKIVVAEDYPLFLDTSFKVPQWLATEIQP